MEYVNLGRSGLIVSRLCFGCLAFGTRDVVGWALGEDEAQPFFRRALDAGVNFFDTADAYSVGASEEITGRALLRYAGRHNALIATKIHARMGPGPNDRGLSRRRVFAAVDACLARLKVDWIDLLNLHRHDPTTPEEETLEALDAVVRAGKVRYLGASNFRAYQLVRMHQTQKHRGWAPFVNYQVHYNLLNREEERENIPYCVEEGIALTPWSPVARGWLAGTMAGATDRARYDPLRDYYGSSADLAIIDRVGQVAARRGARPAQVAVAWMLAKPGITAPIVGATKMYQLDDAVAALDLRLTEDDIAWLEERYVPRRPVALELGDPRAITRGPLAAKS